MLITLHGKLAEDYGKSHEIEASSIYEAVEALSRQLNFYGDTLVTERPTLRIAGCNNPEDLMACPDKIDLMPAMAGGGGVGKILVGAAFIGLSIVTGGAASPFLSSLSSAFMGIGVSLALSGLAQLFTKAPSLSKEKDPDASQYLGLSTNTTKLGTLRSYSMGRVRITSPHLLAVNVDATDLVKGEFPE